MQVSTHRSSALSGSNCSEKTNAHRVKYVDVAKGIGIILVVVGHSFSQENFVLQCINSFHMPLFFILTGYLYSMRSKKTIRYDFRKKAKALLVPYFAWGFLYQLFLGTLNLLGGKTVESVIKENMRVYLTLGSGPMWFLPVMFVSTAVFAIVRQCKNRWIYYGITATLFMLGLFVQDLDVAIVEVLMRCFVAVGFIAIGYEIKSILNLTIKLRYLLLCLLVDLIMVAGNGVVAMASRTFNNPFFFVLTGVLGSLLLIQLSRRVEKYSWATDPLSFLGRHSIVILCTHMFVIHIIWYLDSKFLHDIFANAGVVGGALVRSAVCMAILMLLYPIFKKMHRTFGI